MTDPEEFRKAMKAQHVKKVFAAPLAWDDYWLLRFDLTKRGISFPAWVKKHHNIELSKEDKEFYFRILDILIEGENLNTFAFKIFLDSTAGEVLKSKYLSIPTENTGENNKENTKVL